MILTKTVKDAMYGQNSELIYLQHCEGVDVAPTLGSDIRRKKPCEDDIRRRRVYGANEEDVTPTFKSTFE